MQVDDLLRAERDPAAVETLYRNDPVSFARALPGALAQRPDHPLWQAWQARLFYTEPTVNQTSPELLGTGPVIAITIGLSLLAGTLIKLPEFITSLQDDVYLSRNAPAIVLLALASYFLLSRPAHRTSWLRVLIPAGLALLFINLIPARTRSDTIVMACLHLPLFMWSLAGLAYVGPRWRATGNRMNYLRFNGELLIQTALVLLGGMVLTALTLALFSLIKLHIEEWYFRNVVLYGSVASPLVGALILDRLLAGRVKLAPMLARIFAPLFLITVLTYLVAMVVQQRSPFTDREFLITFNGLLLIVLTLSILVIAERPQHARLGFFDVVSIGLVLATLVIDIIALSAIVFRLSSYGFTPNRIAVLGANLIAFGHLAGILVHYVRLATGRSTAERLEGWIANYLPVYTAWSLIVTVVMPLAYRFK
jgi:hypothetical protein